MFESRQTPAKCPIECKGCNPPCELTPASIVRVLTNYCHHPISGLTKISGVQVANVMSNNENTLWGFV
eukprot:671259-Amorphochlora_amoeboformis.AAC.1